MYLWRRLARQDWWRENERRIRTLASDQLAIIERPNRKQLQLEVASKSRAKLRPFAQQFGGRIQKLPRDWLKRSLREKTKPIRVGTKLLIIPAGAAFGTGEHATTAMCVKMLERVMRFWGGRAFSPAGDRAFAIANSSGEHFSARRVRSPELVVDLGTGTGILALAARSLGAKRVIGFDNDPIAISTAKQNARLNGIRGVDFQLADVRYRKIPRAVEIITANLFSELLIEILPRLKRARCLILSGFLHDQERDLRRALTRNKIDIVDVRRRGKWVAILARRK